MQKRHASSQLQLTTNTIHFSSAMVSSCGVLFLSLVVNAGSKERTHRPCLCQVLTVKGCRKHLHTCPTSGSHSLPPLFVSSLISSWVTTSPVLERGKKAQLFMAARHFKKAPNKDTKSRQN